MKMVEFESVEDGIIEAVVAEIFARPIEQRTYWADAAVEVHAAWITRNWASHSLRERRSAVLWFAAELHDQLGVVVGTA